MNVRKFIKQNPQALRGKTVAITGSTGGLGKPLVRNLAALGAKLFLLDRNAARSQAWRQQLLTEYPDISVECITTELEDIQSVKNACDRLCAVGVDILILNAGAYAIPRHKCSTGYDNIFQINFVSPYYMTRQLLPMLDRRGGRVVAVGSIAHRYSRTDISDVDFSRREGSAKAYGNSKRHLMFSLYELFRGREGASLAVVHPGITFTNITAHYPKLIFAIIKYPMKVIFPRAKKASLCVLAGVFESCEHSEWIGPHLFDIWGAPKKRRLRSVGSEESLQIWQSAEKIYKRLE